MGQFLSWHTAYYSSRCRTVRPGHCQSSCYWRPSSLTIGVAAGPFIIVTTLVRMLRGAPPSPEGYVRADAEGLREHGPGRVTALAWGDIASVRRKRLGQSMLYFATSVDARERITWWTKGAPTLPRDPWEVNATLVSAEELAALVARRSGRAVEDFSAVPEGES